MRKLIALCCVVLLSALAPMALALGADTAPDESVVGSTLGGFWEYLVATVLEIFPTGDPLGFEENLPTDEPSGPPQEAFPTPDPLGFEVALPANEPSGPPQEAFPIPDPIG